MVGFTVSYNRTLTNHCHRRRFAVSRQLDIIRARCAVFLRPIAVVRGAVCFRLEIECRTACAAAVFTCVEARLVRIHLSRLVNGRVRAVSQRTVLIRHRRFGDFKHLRCVTCTLKCTADGKYVTLLYRQYVRYRPRRKFHIMVSCVETYNRTLTHHCYRRCFTVSCQLDIIHARRAVFQRPVVVISRIVCIRSEIECKFTFGVVADTAFVRVHFSCCVYRRLRFGHFFRNRNNVIARNGNIFC